MAIVVSPLIALMHDQVGALHEAGVDAAFSTPAWAMKNRRMGAAPADQRHHLLYAAPERLNTPRFLGLLDDLVRAGG